MRPFPHRFLPLPQNGRASRALLASLHGVRILNTCPTSKQTTPFLFPILCSHPFSLHTTQGSNSFPEPRNLGAAGAGTELVGVYRGRRDRGTGGYPGVARTRRAGGVFSASETSAPAPGVFPSRSSFLPSPETFDWICPAPFVSWRGWKGKGSFVGGQKRNLNPPLSRGGGKGTKIGRAEGTFLFFAPLLPLFASCARLACSCLVHPPCLLRSFECRVFTADRSSNRLCHSSTLVLRLSARGLPATIVDDCSCTVLLFDPSLRFHVCSDRLPSIQAEVQTGMRRSSASSRSLP